MPFLSINSDEELNDLAKYIWKKGTKEIKRDIRNRSPPYRFLKKVGYVAAIITLTGIILVSSLPTSSVTVSATL